MDRRSFLTTGVAAGAAVSAVSTLPAGEAGNPKRRFKMKSGWCTDAHNLQFRVCQEILHVRVAFALVLLGKRLSFVLTSRTTCDKSSFLHCLDCLCLKICNQS